MSSRRTQKAAQAIREVVSMAILADLNDPRVQDVTVTYVEVAPDMRQAKVHVSVRGNETKQRLSLQGLRSAAGFLQAKLASRIETRYTPRLEFVLDLGVKKSIEMSQILGRVLPANPPAEEPAEFDEDDETDESLITDSDRSAGADDRDDDDDNDDD
ncbi:MAG TPA: 30S ribosome-binding factor RbfA [Pirellulales bacterium]|jgi:ribosome-binding factor A